MSPTELLAYLERSGYLPGMVIPSERRLAEEVGMKHSSLNRLLLRMEVQGEFQRVGRKRVRSAQQSSPLKARASVLALAPLGLQSALEQAASSFPLLDIECPRYRLHWQLQEALGTFLNQPRDGLVVWPAHDRALVRTVAETGVPVVQIGLPPMPSVHNVSANMLGAIDLALDHLHACGHEEIGCLDEGDAHSPASEQYRLRAGELFGIRSAARHATRIMNEQDLEQIARDWMQARHAPTALLLRSHTLSKRLFRLMNRLRVAIPQDLSLISIGGDQGFTDLQRVELTTCHFPSREQASLAFGVMQTLLLASRSPFSSEIGVLLQPRLREGGSVRCLQEGKPRRVLAERPSNLRWPINAEDRQALLNRINQASYPVVVNSIGLLQTPVDLGPVANRNVRGRQSWMPHTPFAHLPVGEILIHGIRFVFPDPRKRPATFLHVVGGEPQGRHPLPRTARLVLEEKADYLCFLHASGKTLPEAAIGCYRVAFARGKSLEIPIITRGRSTSAPSTANLQDWWPTSPSVEGEYFRRWVVTNASGDPFEYERNLYTLLWHNPEPGRTIRWIEVELRRDCETHLGLLALTRLHRRKG